MALADFELHPSVKLLMVFGEFLCCRFCTAVADGFNTGIIYAERFDQVFLDGIRSGL